MIAYYIDGSTKDHVIGAGIVKVNEFGFIEKYHFKTEHINPTSQVAEGYSLEKTFEMIKNHDLSKNELIDIYTDCQQLFQSFLFNEKTEFNHSHFFTNQELNPYFRHLRSLYIQLVSKYSNSPLYYSEKTNHARPLIQLFFKDAAEDKKHLQAAHSLSRNYLKDEPIPAVVQLMAKNINNKWHIMTDNQVASENKRPLIALSEALQKLDPRTNQIILCDELKRLLKSTSKNRITNDSMKSAMKTIEKYTQQMNL
jgi:hypothetical protein